MIDQRFKITSQHGDKTSKTRVLTDATWVTAGWCISSYSDANMDRPAGPRGEIFHSHVAKIPWAPPQTEKVRERGCASWAHGSFICIRELPDVSGGRWLSLGPTCSLTEGNSWHRGRECWPWPLEVEQWASACPSWGWLKPCVFSPQSKAGCDGGSPASPAPGDHQSG